MIKPYFHSERPTKHKKPGYCQYAGIAPISWFKKIATPYSDPIVIEGLHEFHPGLEFIRCYSLPQAITSTAESFGELGATSIGWKVGLFIPGDSKELQIMLELLRNDDLILLIKDIDCDAQYRLQYGSGCMPAKFMQVNFTTGNVFDGRKGWELILWSSGRTIYEDASSLLYVEDGYWDDDIVN